MKPIRTVPGPNAISDVSGEDFPEGPEPDYPEATDVRVSSTGGQSIDLLLDTQPSSE